MNKKLLLIATSFLLTSCYPFVVSVSNPTTSEPTVSAPTSEPITVPGTTSDPTTIDPTTSDPTIPPTVDPTSDPTISVDPTTTSTPTTSEVYEKELTAIDIVGDMETKNYELGNNWDFSGLEVIFYYDDGSDEIATTLINAMKSSDYSYKLSVQAPELTTTQLRIDLEYKPLTLSITKYISGIIVTEPEPPEELDGYFAPGEYELSDTFPNTYNQLSSIYPYDYQYTPSTGDVNILVIPVAFADSVEDTDINLQHIQRAFNGTPEQTGWMSTEQYFGASSYQTFNPTFEIAPTWYKDSRTMAEVGTAEVTTTIDILQNAVQWYKDNHTTDDCQKFDSNGDGYIDAVCLIYAAHNYTVINKDFTNFWAYAFSAQARNPHIADPKPNMFLWAAYDFLLPQYRGSPLLNVDSHTLTHEFGHVLGLNDYYDYAQKSSPAGGFDMQDLNVGDHNGFSKFALGWTKPYVVNGNAEITLTSSSLNKDQIIIIPAGGYNSWNKSPFDEYLLLEFYTPEGNWEFDANNQTFNNYPTGLTDVGVKLYHVDARLYEYEIKNNSLYARKYASSISPNYVYDVAATNTTSGTHQALVPSCRAYDQLHLLSATGVDRFSTFQYINKTDLFRYRDKFSMTEFASFFPNYGVFNNGKECNISFEITALSKDSVTITFTKD